MSKPEIIRVALSLVGIRPGPGFTEQLPALLGIRLPFKPIRAPQRAQLELPHAGATKHQPESISSRDVTTSR